MKTIKTVVFPILTALIILSALTTPVSATSDFTIEMFAEEIRAKYKDLYTDDRSHYIIDEVLRIVIPDPEFVYIFNDNLDDAYRIIEETLDGSMKYEGELFINPDTGVGVASKVVIPLSFSVLILVMLKRERLFIKK